MKKLCLLFYQKNEFYFIHKISLILILISICIIIIIIYLERKFRKLNYDLYYREELFSTLCSNVDDVFVIYNVINKKFDYISPNFEKSLGINSNLLFHNKLDLSEYISLDNVKKIRAIFNDNKIVDMQEVDFEYTKPHDKHKRWILMRVYPVYKRNNIIRYICCTTDLTKEKQTQKAIEEAFLNVQKANEAKKEFLSHMSHELKTPINAIIGMTQIASNSLVDTEKVSICLEKINFSSKKLLTLINNILDISKLDSDKLILANEPFCLSEILIPFTSMMNTQAELNHQEFNFFIKQMEDDYLIGDSLRLLQIFENCISNSMKFTPPGGTILFEVTEQGRYLQTNQVRYQFIISDTGKGMKKEYLEHLFIPFDQEDNTVFKNYGGTGLGMSIVKNLIQLMDGTIQVTSKINAGTKITIELTFLLAHGKSKQTEAKDIKVSPNEYNCKGKRILVVEDNEINLEITCEFLKYINAEFETATNGFDAIKLFEASKTGYYDIILMDVQMPGLNGYETTKLLRSSIHPDAKSICIIAMTADDFSDDQSSFDCGMNYHITKPIVIDELYCLIKTISTEENDHGVYQY